MEVVAASSIAAYTSRKRWLMNRADILLAFGRQVHFGICGVPFTLTGNRRRPHSVHQ